MKGCVRITAMQISTGIINNGSSKDGRDHCEGCGFGRKRVVQYEMVGKMGSFCYTSYQKQRTGTAMPLTWRSLILDLSGYQNCLRQVGAHNQRRNWSDSRMRTAVANKHLLGMLEALVSARGRFEHLRGLSQENQIAYMFISC